MPTVMSTSVSMHESEVRVFRELLEKVGLEPGEVDDWVRKLMVDPMVDFQCIRDGLQYLILMKSECAADALRALGFSPLVEDVYTYGEENGWINYPALKNWGFTLVEVEAEDGRDCEEYLAISSMSLSRELNLVPADEIEYVCSTKARVGPDMFGMGDAEVAPCQTADLALGEPATQLVHPGLPGFKYLELFDSSYWAAVAVDLGAYPSVAALMTTCSEALDTGDLNGGWRLQRYRPGVYTIRSAPLAHADEILADLRSAYLACENSIMADDVFPSEPVVLYRSDVEGHGGAAENDYKPGDPVAVNLDFQDGRAEFSFPSVYPVMVVFRSGIEVEFPSGPVLSTRGTVLRVFGLAGLSVKLKSDNLVNTLVTVIVGDERAKDLWLRRYAWTGGNTNTARFISSVDCKLAVFNFGKHRHDYFDAHPAMMADVDEMDGKRVVNTCRVTSSGVVSSSVDGSDYRVGRGRVVLSSETTDKAVKLELRAGNAAVVLSQYLYMCDLQQGAEVLQVDAEGCDVVDGGVKLGDGDYYEF